MMENSEEGSLDFIFGEKDSSQAEGKKGPKK